MNARTLSPSRRSDLDWLRVLLILVVFIFHSLRFFDLENWTLKNASTYFGVQVFITFLSSWMMPLIFVVSGAGVYYALGKRGASTFVRERVLRLLVPLVVGIFTHVAWQVYIGQISAGQFSGSFWQWYPTYFNGLDRYGGSFAWMGNHLWYLEMLFIFSLVCLPLFLWLRRGAGARALAWLGDHLAAPGAIYLPALPIILVIIIVDPASFLGNRGWGGWSIIAHLVFFLIGFLLASSEPMQAVIRRLRRVSLAAGSVCVLVTFGLYAFLGDTVYGTLPYAVFMVMNGLVNWTWMLAILGFSLVRLNFRTPALDYANEAVLPFYIMHQSLLFAVGYFVLAWPIADLAKWAIIALVTFALIMLLYEFVVRRINILRFLFGMKPLPRARSVEELKPASAQKI
jgi:glucans biosynthesis protein C